MEFLSLLWGKVAIKFAYLKIITYLYNTNNKKLNVYVS